MYEVIVVDSGAERLTPPEILSFSNLRIQYITAEKSVCIQRNTGIKQAASPWIFICDDDIEPPVGYLTKLSAHLNTHLNAGAVSGLIMQKEAQGWVSNYPVTSLRLLVWKFIFQLSIWGPLPAKGNNFVLRKLKQYYLKRGNHISKAGWPVLINFEGDYFETPVYGLGAALIKKEWLLHAPYDEVLDRNGIGDNYGVALRFPGNIHVLNNAFVYHHRAVANRLQQQLVYYRRALALDYFRKKIPRLKQSWLLWSLKGNFLFYILTLQLHMLKPALKSILKIAAGKNPYIQAACKQKKVTEPQL